MIEGFQKKIEKSEIDQLPVLAYSGEIVVIEKPEEVEEALDFLETQPMLGFDTETRPSFRKGETHQVSLLQIATEEKVYLFRLHLCGFQRPLKWLLGNPKILKIGVGIRDDLRMLKQVSPFQADGFVDMQTFAAQFGIEEKSFSKLMAIIFGVKISKRQRTSNWEAPSLNEAQLRYAATDAWGALKMYQYLQARHEAQLPHPATEN